MRKSILRRCATALAVTILATAASAAAVPAPALAAPCSGTSGVTVVVDFTALGGGVTVACALGDPNTGIAALQGGGFSVTGTKRWGLAFVCRINGLPAPAAEPCVNTPPATAYWSYWHAPAGGSWTFSTVGATGYNPAPGTVEGWAFGAGTAPAIPPP
jgi:hypothetical protein